MCLCSQSYSTLINPKTCFMGKSRRQEEHNTHTNMFSTMVWSWHVVSKREKVMVKVTVKATVSIQSFMVRG